MNNQRNISKHMLQLTIVIISLCTVVLSTDIHKTLRLACEGTSHSNLCISTLSSLSPEVKSSGIISDLIAANLNNTISMIRYNSIYFSSLRRRFDPNLSQRNSIAFQDCLKLLDYTVFDLNTAISELRSSSIDPYNVNTLISAAMTNQYTCLDSFENNGINGVIDNMKSNILNISNHLSNSLEMLKQFPVPENMKSETDVEFPTWITGIDQEMLQTPVEKTKFDLVVAKDGTGNFTTMAAAISAAPVMSTTRFVIYIKAGVYIENVKIEQNKTMITLIGDGIGKTIIKGNQNAGDYRPLFETATFLVLGANFIGKYITFVNDAGPGNHQAVAFASGSDFSALYRCSFEGYQDTLYLYSLKQFYRECDIYGTIDFIFGNAAAVLQNCNLYARRPGDSEGIIYTAQGRNHKDQRTGISIINCKFLAATDLIPVKDKFNVYLGRPWKEYSRTVIIKSFIDEMVNPAGWFEWRGDFALDTLYFGEYMNYGPGSNVVNRVKWPGYRQIKDELEAMDFTVGPFIEGDKWLNATGIPFNLGL